MHKDERDLLDVLKFELEFLEKGGYGRSPRDPWRPQFIFEDSPTCMNYDSREHPEPCSECVLIGLVPPASREEKIPCRHIPFNVDGDTLDSLYRWCEPYQTEEVVRTWLKTTIAKLEEQRATQHEKNIHHDALPGPSEAGIPLHHNLHPKCANPACPTAFHWLGGGKFFRFRPRNEAETRNAKFADAPANLHGVRHYWLCEHCAHIFTLVYENESGVVLKLLWPELAVTEPQKATLATQKG
jgi:hypothetical protein